MANLEDFKLEDEEMDSAAGGAGVWREGMPSCKYCHIMFNTEEERNAHQETCDAWFGYAAIHGHK